MSNSNSISEFNKNFSDFKKNYSNMLLQYQYSNSYLATKNASERIVDQYLLRQKLLESKSKTLIENNNAFMSVSNKFLKNQAEIATLSQSFIEKFAATNLFNNFNSIAKKFNNLEIANSSLLNKNYVNKIIDSLSAEIANDDILHEQIPINKPTHDNFNIESCEQNIIALKESLFEDKTTIDFHKWICTIGAIISIIFSILSYTKPSHDEEYIKLLKEINSHLEQVAQLESGH